MSTSRDISDQAPEEVLPAPETCILALGTSYNTDYRKTESIFVLLWKSNTIAMELIVLSKITWSKIEYAQYSGE
ncbi:hypothetical protein DS67_00855 [Mesotoga sp. SC_4PWA21]|nr:hypothetical protein DS67_00855 [Mesotoga sp. SC_4PWA21]